MLREGAFLQNRYEIISLIGSGGMSDVYKARCHKLDRLVAVKVLKDELSNDAGFVAKFKMEAQAAAGLSHPNIVSVYDVVDEGNLHYIVMELIEGITLKSYILKKGVLDVREAVGIAIQVAQGIAAAHEQNIIHRDIKPQNMIISKDGKVKVADFGIARLASAQTQGSVAVGSVHYISPEQARGGYSDARSDIYSLGITLYEMVTGRVPFEGESTVAIALAHVEEPITRPSIYNPDIPVGLENVILKCTEKRPDRRYPSVTDVIADLRRVLLHPDDDLDLFDEEDDFGDETRPISADELRAINAGHKAYIPSDEPYRDRDRKRVSGGTDVRRGVETLLAGVGVFVAILIVAVLIFLFSRLGGLFRSGSGWGSTGDTIHTELLPTESSIADTEIFMPSATDLPVDMAEEKLKEYTLVMRVVGYEDSDSVPSGYVIRQNPEEGTVVQKYSSVDVIVSNGDGTIDVTAMNLIGMNQESASAVLRQRGLVPQFVEEHNDAVSAGMVIRFDPLTAKEGEQVTLYVSLGPAPVLVTVPDLYNVPEDEARRRLAEAGLAAGEATVQNDDVIPAGNVISQAVPAGTGVEIGSSIAYTVSDGPEIKYYAAISETFSMKSQMGPGALETSYRVTVRLRQDGSEGSEYRTLMETREIGITDMLPIEYPRLEAIFPGAEYGEVEVVNSDSGEVIKGYPVRFFSTE